MKMDSHLKTSFFLEEDINFICLIGYSWDQKNTFLFKYLNNIYSDEDCKWFCFDFLFLAFCLGFFFVFFSHMNKF